MTIGRRFLPESVNLRLTAIFDRLREAGGFGFEEFHKCNGRDGFAEASAAPGGRALPE